MKSREFVSLCKEAWGERWREGAAGALSVNSITVSRWAKGALQIPSGVAQELYKIVGTGSDSGFPRDEWLIHEAERAYVIHTVRPRFIARVVEIEETGEPRQSEEPVDFWSGVTFGIGDLLLCEIAWIDPAPALDDLELFFNDAIEAFRAE